MFKLIRCILTFDIRPQSRLFRLVDKFYWEFVRKELDNWGETGLHATRIGGTVVGSSKQRSFYRERMLMPGISLVVNFEKTSVLDLACNDGFWSFNFGRLGVRKLYGIDTNEESIQRANFLKSVYNFRNFKFENRDIFGFLENRGRDKERFDVVLLLSILYHFPEDFNPSSFFKNISHINDKFLIIDSRWFDNESYWFKQTVTPEKINKWRPKRQEVLDLLREAEYNHIIEVDVSCFLNNLKEAEGDGDPYSLENVADYITNNRSILIAHKRSFECPRVISGSQFMKTHYQHQSANS